MRKETLEDDWWVIGNIESRMYLHWKGDFISGCFVDVCDPEDAERYGSAEEASRAIQEDEDVQSEISTWNNPAGPIHVKKGVIVSDEPEGFDPLNKDVNRARLLCCMDYIMHHLNDEESIEPWLVNGVPDGLYQSASEPQAGDYRDLDLSDESFNRMVGVFINTLALEGGCRVSGKKYETVGKDVLS